MRIGSISDREIETARNVLEDHTVTPLNHEGALENLLWCISSQATTWEVASTFVYNLREASYPGDERALSRYSSTEVLHNKNAVNHIANETKLRFAYGERFNESIDYFSQLGEGWWQDVLHADEDARAEYVRDVKWLGLKTFSFWNICLGGKDLIALDVHIMRNLAEGFDLEINEDYYIPVKREKGSKIIEKVEMDFFGLETTVERVEFQTPSQTVRKTPDKKDYFEIEKQTRDYFSQDDRFLYSTGEGGSKVDMALVDAVLWWRGAERASDVGMLFDIGKSEGLPYGNLERFF